MIKFEVLGMSCGHCAKKITQAVNNLDSQAAVNIDIANSILQIDSAVDAHEFAKAINALGYKAIPR